MKWKLVNAKNGQATVVVENNGQSIYMHSSYSPEREVKRWVQRIELQKWTDKLYIIGMGIGYHIQALRDKFPNIPIEVWDFNDRYKKWAKATEIVEELVENNVIYKSSENLLEINKGLLEKIKEKNVELIIHKPSLSLIPEELNLLREKLIDIHFIKESILDKATLLRTNFESNLQLNDEGISNQLKEYRGRPFLLISAGPSLTKQLPLIKQFKDNREIIIGCVGTALKPLLAEAITPDFVMVSDPLDNIFKQIDGVETKNLTLFYLSTANYRTVSFFRGKRYIVWQSEYDLARNEAGKRQESLVETGGSVATCLLDLMVKMGASKIALVGQDLAYTGGVSHAVSTTDYRSIQQEVTQYEIDNYYLNGKVPTSKNLMIYLNWFERYSKKNSSVELLNCTEGGAHIQGWKHIPLKIYLDE